MKRCVIAGAGEYSEKNWETMEAMYKKNQNDSNGQEIETLYIAADGGYLIYKNKRIIPDVWIGDFDSYNRDDTDVTKELIQLSKEKDDTDMLAAIRVGLERGCKEFHIIGGMGKRIEHTLANFQCLSFLCRNGARGYMYGEEQIFTVIKNESYVIKKNENKYVSLFAMTGEAQGVTLSGFKYLLDDVTIKNDFPIGISNELVKNNGQICVKDGELLLIF